MDTHTHTPTTVTFAEHATPAQVGFLSKVAFFVFTKIYTLTSKIFGG